MKTEQAPLSPAAARHLEQVQLGHRQPKYARTLTWAKCSRCGLSGSTLQATQHGEYQHYHGCKEARATSFFRQALALFKGR